MEICSKMHKVTVHSCWLLSPAPGHVTETDRAYVGPSRMTRVPASVATCRGIAATRQNLNILYTFTSKGTFVYNHTISVAAYTLHASVRYFVCYF
jgi:hypothetical protein